ncbi:MAG: TniQ family protein [Spongiibacteraceae bacterium]
MRIELCQLPIRPVPLNGESAWGYVRRIAYSNGYRDAQHLLNAFKIGRGGHLQWADDPLQKVIEVNATNDLSGHDAHRLMHHVRCCPDCLREYGYWREQWECGLVPICTEHRRALVAKCPVCTRLLRNSHTRLFHCECDADLREVDVNSLHIDDQACALASLMLKLSESSTQCHNLHFANELAALSDLELNRQVLFLGAYKAFRTLSKPRKLSIKGNPEIALAVLTGAAAVLSEWPTGLEQLISDINPRKSRSVRSQLGYLYIGVHKDFAEPEFAFFREAFDAMLIDQWPDLLDAKSRWLENKLRDQPYISATVLAKQASVRSKQLRLWVQSGQLEGTIHKLPSGRVQIAIRKDQLKKITNLKNRFNLEMAAEYVGLPEKRLRELLQARVIIADTPAAGALWQIHCSELDRLICSLKFTESNLRPDTDYLTINQILRHRWAKHMDFVQFIEAISAGEIVSAWPTSARSRNFGQLHIEVTSFNQWIEKGDMGFSIPEVCRILNIKQEVGYHLIKKNIIVAEDFGRLGRRVTTAALRQFQNEYCFARDLARARLTTSRSLVIKLAKFNVHPVVGPAIDKCRQIVYSRDVLKDF